MTEDRPSAVSRRRAQTRDRLMAAALRVFAERGVIGASVEEICDAAGFTRGAFYSNFADKDALVLALLEAATGAQLAATEATLQELGGAAAEVGLDELLPRVLDRLDATGPAGRESVLVQQELMLHAARVPALRGPYSALVETRSTQLRALIVRALDASGLQFVLPFDQALELLVAAHNQAQHKMLIGGAVDFTPLRSLILTITRAVPAAGGRPAEGAEAGGGTTVATSTGGTAGDGVTAAPPS